MRTIIVLLLALWAVSSCGGRGEDAKQQEAKPAQKPEPVQAISDSDLSEFDRLANAFIRPYFDAEATQTEKTVKPGENFDLYVFAEYSKDFAMCGAEFRLVIPEGVKIVSAANTDSTIITMGDVEDFTTTFRPTAGPKAWLVRYTCTSDPSFQGGAIRTDKGARLHFLGFTMCDSEFTMVNAQHGEATITVE
jgi:hypothetical protein